MEPPNEAQQREGGKQQSLFREVNERIADLNADWESDERELLCECSDHDCVQRISLTHAEYEAVRSRSTCFVVAPGHEQAELEQVVARNDRFAVVEKFGAAQDVAIHNDPRTRTQPRDAA